MESFENQKIVMYEKKDEKFTGAMSLTEKVDMIKLRIIRDNFKELWDRVLGKKMKIQIKGGLYKTVKDYKQAFSTINQFYNSKLKTDIVKYRFSSKINYGRRFHCVPSLQECPRPVRHTIAKEKSFDLDIKNAHPVFLLNLCRSYGFSHPILEQYVEGDREIFLKTLFGMEITRVEYDEEEKVSFVKHTINNREDAKGYFLQCLNGGGNNKSANQTMNAFFDRQQEFLKIFFNRKENDKYRLRAIESVKKKKWDNKEGSALNYYLCEVENIGLTHIEKCLQDEGVQYGTLCFDGLLIYKESVKDINILLNKVQTIVSEKMGFNINLSVKDMDEDLDLKGLYPHEDVNMTDEGLAKYMLEAIKDDIKFSKKKNTIYRYNLKSCLWEEFEVECFKTILSPTLIPIIKTHPDEEKIEGYIEVIQSNTKQNNIISQMKARLMLMNDDNLIDEKFDAGNGFFPISDNKVLNFRTLEVENRERIHFFTRTTNRKYLVNYDVKFVQKYFHDLLVKIPDEDQKVKSFTSCDSCNEMGYICPSIAYVKCLIQSFACILTGEMNLSMKKFINLIGEGNNGKSLFLMIIQMILEEFSGSVSNRVIVEQKHKSGHDAELFGLANKWMMCLSETDSKTSYDEVRLKQITGYDAVPLRDAGGNSKSMIQVRFKAVPVCSTNEVCQFKSPAFYNRLMCFAFHFKFEQKPLFVEKAISKIDDFFSFLCQYAKEFYDSGKTFHIAEEVVKYTNSIKKAQDPLLLWLDNCEILEKDEKGLFIRGDDEYNNRIPKEKMFHIYKQYCENNNYQFLGTTTFHKEFQKIFKITTSKVLVKVFDGEKQKECYTGFRIPIGIDLNEF